MALPRLRRDHDPSILDPGGFGANVNARFTAVGEDYAAATADSRVGPCRYNAAKVVLPASERALPEVAPHACDGFRYVPPATS